MKIVFSPNSKSAAIVAKSVESPELMVDVGAVEEEQKIMMSFEFVFDAIRNNNRR